MEILGENELLDRIGICLEQARTENREVALLIIGIDQIPWVRQNYGKEVLSSLVQEITRRLGLCTRDQDQVLAQGEAHLVLVLNAFSTEKNPLYFARRFLDTLAAPIPVGRLNLSCSACMGIAVFPFDGTLPSILMNNALSALEAARELGANHFRFFSAEMSHRIGSTQGIEDALRRALKNGELFLSYQPQLDLRTGRISGVEALLRWHHPQQGDVSPDQFIRVAENSGLILPIGEWVLHTACHEARRWQLAGIAPLRMGVNVSARQFQLPDFVERVEAILQETGLPPQFLELEMTESTVMGNIQEAILTLTDLKIRNIHLAIDDFGTGYSSLVYLKHFPFDRIKIAQEFVRDIPGDPDDEAIVDAILMMARSLKLEVIAEGVEKRAQLQFLKARHCREMQGFYFSPPLSGQQMQQCLRDSQDKNHSCLLHH